MEPMQSGETMISGLEKERSYMEANVRSVLAPSSDALCSMVHSVHSVLLQALDSHQSSFCWSLPFGFFFFLVLLGACPRASKTMLKIAFSLAPFSRSQLPWHSD